MGDLDDLIKAVEAGHLQPDVNGDFIEGSVFPSIPGGVFDTQQIIDILYCYNGDLNAALRLHESLLPGHTRAVDATAPEMGIRVDVWSPEGPITGIGDNAVESRAWLLAILRALQAQSTPPISPEQAQFNAVRYHERFGPLDEKGNPLDPRRRG